MTLPTLEEVLRKLRDGTLPGAEQRAAHDALLTLVAMPSGAVPGAALPRRAISGIQSADELGPVKRLLEAVLWDDGLLTWEITTLRPGMSEPLVTSGAFSAPATKLFLHAVGLLLADAEVRAL